jgi:crossover junction endonuclease EME1
VTHSCLIHHTTAPPDSAEWIKNFTEHISTVPYRRERQEAHNAAFCMDVGQVKSGVDKHDTFVKMMQEVNRITAPMAYGIAGQYPCVTDLVRGMRMHGNMMLEDIRVGFVVFPYHLWVLGPAYLLFFLFFSRNPRTRMVR